MRKIQAIPMLYLSYIMNRKYVCGTFSTPKAVFHRFSESRRLENEIAKRCNSDSDTIALAVAAVTAKCWS